MMGTGPLCYIQKFMKIGPLVLEKIFEGFLPYIGVAAILVIRPTSYYHIFNSLYLKAYIRNFVENDPVVSVKGKF